MPFAFDKVKGLPREALLGAIEPVLQAHGLEGVELIWRTDNRGRVLYLTVERPGSRVPGEGVTLDDCSELSRDLSAALDVADVISAAYRLEVGTPGLERLLYSREDYGRFSGQSAKVKLKQPLDGEWTLRGLLLDLDEQQRVVLDTERGVFALDFEQIEQGNLLLDFGGPKPAKRTSNARRAEKLAQRRAASQRVGGAQPAAVPQGPADSASDFTAAQAEQSKRSHDRERME